MAGTSPRIKSVLQSRKLEGFGDLRSHLNQDLEIVMLGFGLPFVQHFLIVPVMIGRGRLLEGESPEASQWVRNKYVTQTELKWGVY